MDLTPKQQTSEAIRQADTILILTGQHPSVDQATAVIALTAILRKFGKTVTPVISDNPPASVAMLDSNVIERNLGGLRDFVLKLDVTKTEVDKLRYEVADGKLNIYLTPFRGGFAPSDVTFGYGGTNINYDLAIVLGVPTRARIDRVLETNSNSFENIPLLNLDFHRSNENYGAVNLIEPNASSLCEMLVALSESLQSGIIDGEIATALLMGIVASTDRFTAAHTSPKSLTVAAQMMAAGARQQAVMKALYRDGKADGRGTERADRTERGDRGGERSDRGERAERNPERSGSERGGRDGQAARPQPARPAEQTRPEPARPEPARPAEQPRREEPRPEPVRAEQPRREEPRASEPAKQPELAPESLAAAALTAANEHVAQMPPVPPVPAAPVHEVPHFEEDAPADDNVIIQPGHIEMMSQAEAQAPTQPRPQAMPMTDFAAAAEMFKREPAKPKTDQDAS